MNGMGLCHAAAGCWRPPEETASNRARSWLGPAYVCTFASSVILEKAELQFYVKPPLRLFAKAVWITFLSTRGDGDRDRDRLPHWRDSLGL